jgi:hypothetical protein
MDGSHMIDDSIKTNDAFFIGAIGFYLHDIIKAQDFAITHCHPKLKGGSIFGSQYVANRLDHVAISTLFSKYSGFPYLQAIAFAISAIVAIVWV